MVRLRKTVTDKGFAGYEWGLENCTELKNIQKDRWEELESQTWVFTCILNYLPIDFIVYRGNILFHVIYKSQVYVKPFPDRVEF
jgi:hypothetical protein